MCQVDGTLVAIERERALICGAQRAAHVGDVARRIRRRVDEHAPTFLGGDVPRRDGREWERLPHRPRQRLVVRDRAEAGVLQHELDLRADALEASDLFIPN